MKDLEFALKAAGTAALIVSASVLLFYTGAKVSYSLLYESQVRDTIAEVVHLEGVTPTEPKQLER